MSKSAPSNAGELVGEGDGEDVVVQTLEGAPRRPRPRLQPGNKSRATPWSPNRIGWSTQTLSGSKFLTGCSRSPTRARRRGTMCPSPHQRQDGPRMYVAAISRS